MSDTTESTNTSSNNEDGTIIFRWWITNRHTGQRIYAKGRPFPIKIKG